MSNDTIPVGGYLPPTGPDTRHTRWTTEANGIAVVGRHIGTVITRRLNNWPITRGTMR